MRRNHLLWVAPLLAMLGLVTYWTVFARWKALNDIPWVNLSVLVLALALAFRALTRAWPRGGWRRIAGGLAVVWSTGLLGLLSWYVFAFSADMPDPANALSVGARVPALVLSDQDANAVDLAAAAEKPLVLVFFRGFW